MKRFVILAAVWLMMMTALTPVSAKAEPITASVTAVEQVSSTPLMDVSVSGPTLLGTQQRGHQVLLSWSTISGVTGYEIWRGPTEAELVWLTDSTETQWIDTTVIIGNTYVYSVIPYTETESVRSYGESTNTISITVVSEYDFLAPKSLHAYYDEGVVYLSWNSDWKVESYTIRRKLMSESTYVDIATIEASLDNTFEDATAVGGSKYHYVIVANKTGASGEALTKASDPIELYAVENLYLPDGVAYGTVNRHNFEFDALYPNLTQIKLYRSTSPDGPFTFLSNVNFGANEVIASAWYTVTWGTTYYYKYRAEYQTEYSWAYSDFSDPFAVTTSSDITNLTVWNGGVNTLLLWDTNFGSQSYEVYASRDGVNYELLAVTPASNYVHSDLTLGDTWVYKVRAVYYVSNVKNFGDYTDPVTNVVSPAFTLVIGEYINKSTVKLSWEYLEISLIDGFMLYKTTNGVDYTFVAEYDWDVKEATISGLSTTQVTGFKLVAYIDFNGQRHTSEPLSDPLIPLLMAPELSAGVTTASGISIHWKAVTGAEAYIVYRSVGGNYLEIDEIARVSALSYTDKQVQAGKSYDYYVVPIVRFGTVDVEGLVSNSVSAIAQPLILNQDRMGIDSTATTLKVFWEAIPGVAGYELQRSLYADNNYGSVITLTTASYTHTGLSLNTSVYYRVRAFYLVDGVKVYTNYIQKGGKTKLATPVMTATTINPTTIALSWKAITGASSYSIYIYRPYAYDFALLKTVTTTSYTHTDSFFIAERPYAYYVVANSSMNISSNSSEIVIAYPSVAAPTNVKAVPTSDTVSVTFTAAAKAVGYEVMIYSVDTGEPVTRYEGERHL